MVPDYNARPSSRVSRQAGMTCGIDVARTNPLPDLECWPNRWLVARCDAAAQPPSGRCQCERRGRFDGSGSDSRLQLVRRDEAVFHELLLESIQPSLVIAHAQILARMHDFKRVSVGVETPFAPGTHRTVQRIHTAFPARVEDRFILLVLDWPHALLPAHVVHPVHA